MLDPNEPGEMVVEQEQEQPTFAEKLAEAINSLRDREDRSLFRTRRDRQREEEEARQQVLSEEEISPPSDEVSMPVLQDTGPDLLEDPNTPMGALEEVIEGQDPVEEFFTAAEDLRNAPLTEAQETLRDRNVTRLEILELATREADEIDLSSRLTGREVPVDYQAPYSNLRLGETFAGDSRSRHSFGSGDIYNAAVYPGYDHRFLDETNSFQAPAEEDLRVVNPRAFDFSAWRFASGQEQVAYGGLGDETGHFLFLCAKSAAYGMSIPYILSSAVPEGVEEGANYSLITDTTERGLSLGELVNSQNPSISQSFRDWYNWIVETPNFQVYGQGDQTTAIGMAQAGASERSSDRDVRDRFNDRIVQERQSQLDGWRNIGGWFLTINSDDPRFAEYEAAGLIGEASESVNRPFVPGTSASDSWLMSILDLGSTPGSAGDPAYPGDFSSLFRPEAVPQGFILLDENGNPIIDPGTLPWERSGFMVPRTEVGFGNVNPFESEDQTWRNMPITYPVGEEGQMVTTLAGDLYYLYDLAARRAATLERQMRGEIQRNQLERLRRQEEEALAGEGVTRATGYTYYEVSELFKGTSEDGEEIALEPTPELLQGWQEITGITSEEVAAYRERFASVVERGISTNPNSVEFVNAMLDPELGGEALTATSVRAINYLLTYESTFVISSFFETDSSSQEPGDSSGFNASRLGGLQIEHAELSREVEQLSEAVNSASTDVEQRGRLAIDLQEAQAELEDVQTRLNEEIAARQESPSQYRASTETENFDDQLLARLQAKLDMAEILTIQDGRAQRLDEIIRNRSELRTTARQLSNAERQREPRSFEITVSDRVMSDDGRGHDTDFTFDFTRDQSPEQLRNMVRERLYSVPGSGDAESLPEALRRTFSINPNLEASLYRSIEQSIRPYRWNEALGLWMDYSDESIRPILDLTDSITEQLNRGRRGEARAVRFWGGTQGERLVMQEGREAVRQVTPDPRLIPVEAD